MEDQEEMFAESPVAGRNTAWPEVPAPSGLEDNPFAERVAAPGSVVSVEASAMLAIAFELRKIREAIALNGSVSSA